MALRTCVAFLATFRSPPPPHVQRCRVPSPTVTNSLHFPGGDWLWWQWIRCAMCANDWGSDGWKRALLLLTRLSMACAQGGHRTWGQPATVRPRSAADAENTIVLCVFGTSFSLLPTTGRGQPSSRTPHLPSAEPGHITYDTIPPPPRGASQRGRLWTACGQRCVGSKNSQTTPATTSTTPIRQLLGAADAPTAHLATFSTAPAHQILGSASAEMTPAGAPAAAADRRQRPDAAREGKTG